MLLEISEDFRKHQQYADDYTFSHTYLFMADSGETMYNIAVHIIKFRFVLQIVNVYIVNIF